MPSTADTLPFGDPLCKVWRCSRCGRIDTAAVEHDDGDGRMLEVERMRVSDVRRAEWCPVACETERRA